MSRCPRCGTQVSVPQRTWTMAGRPDASGFRIVLTIGLYSCPSCGIPFREVVSRNRESVTGTAELRTCPNCGHLNTKDYDYCSSCGKLFDDSARLELSSRIRFGKFFIVVECNRVYRRQFPERVK